MMLNKRRSSSPGGVVIREGCLIKSPPTGVIFTSRSSWKERLVKICRTTFGTYHIRYYAYSGEKEELKGEIAISDIQSIELGTNLRERIQTIVKLFNNSPENVLCIKTNKRDYYLVDDDKNNILDWKTSLTNIWVQFNRGSNEEGTQITDLPSPTSEVSQPEAARPNSYPPNYPRTDPGSEVEDRQRSLSDPDKRRGKLQPPNQRTEEKLPPEPSRAPESERRQTGPDIFSDTSEEILRFLLSSTCESPESRRSSEDCREESDSEDEHIYDFPRLFSVGKAPSLDNTEDALSSGFESPDDDGYEQMQPLPQNAFDSERNGCASPKTEQSVPNLPEATECPRAPEQTARYPQNPKRNSELLAEPIRGPKAQGRQLKKTYLLKLMYEERDAGSDLVKMDITVPTAHLQKYLGLQEVGERLCICKWKGPSEIGCLFHYGDHIEAVNGVRPGTEDFFLQMLNKTIADKVNLVVIRNKKAEVFHVEGCRCEES